MFSRRALLRIAAGIVLSTAAALCQSQHPSASPNDTTAKQAKATVTISMESARWKSMDDIYVDLETQNTSSVPHRFSAEDIESTIKFQIVDSSGTSVGCETERNGDWSSQMTFSGPNEVLAAQAVYRYSAHIVEWQCPNLQPGSYQLKAYWRFDDADNLIMSNTVVFQIVPHAGDIKAEKLALIHKQLKVFQASGDSEDFKKVVMTLRTCGPSYTPGDPLGMIDVYGEVFHVLDQAYPSAFGEAPRFKPYAMNNVLTLYKPSAAELAERDRAAAESNRLSELSVEDQEAVFAFLELKRSLMQKRAWNDDKVQERLAGSGVVSPRIEQLLHMWLPD